MNILLIFNSATSAKRVEKTIAKFGILSTVVHTPKSISKTGCSHSVRIAESDYKMVCNILSERDIYILGAYKEMKISGKYAYKELVL